MFLKTFLFYFKNFFFFIQEKLKETMSRKETKFCEINFIDPRIIFLKNKILTPRAM